METRVTRPLVVLALVLGVMLMAMPFSAAASSSPAAIAVPDDAIMFAAASPAVRTHTVIGLYAEPAASGAVLSWVMPDMAVHVLGLSADGIFWAVSVGEKSTAMAGWMSSKNLDYAPATRRAATVTPVYRQRDSKSAVVDVLAPGQTLGLLGATHDLGWSAIMSRGAAPRLGWVVTSNLQRDYGTANAQSLTKTHTRADEGSAVFDVLPPVQTLSVLGRSRDGAWLAMSSPGGGRFLGWAHSGDIQYAGNKDALPVLPLP